MEMPLPSLAMASLRSMTAVPMAVSTMPSESLATARLRVDGDVTADPVQRQTGATLPATVLRS